MYQNKYLEKILFSALFVFAFVCPGYAFCESGADNTAKYALKDGKCMAYYCKAVNEPYWLGGGGNNCEGMCSSLGEKQYKVNGACGTLERTCCSNGSWSDWGKDCPAVPSCSSSQCWNGSSCESKGSVSRSCSGNVANATSGTQTRTASCSSGTGWNYGSWSGTCTCKQGYKWAGNGFECVAPPDPAYITCLNSGSTVRAYIMHNSSTLIGTPYNADYYYVIKVPLTRDPSASYGSCYSSYVEATVNVSSYVSGAKEYSLSAQVPSGCKMTCTYSYLDVVSKGWKS